MQQPLIAGRYRLLALVGTGGMGRVWRARDEMLHRDVAVKEIVAPGWLTESERDEVHRRTLREARTAARLDHPHVVRVYDVLADWDGHWLVMEYVPSRSLQQIVTADGPLEPARAARVGLAVLAALRAAHAAGVLHRDVKPHNVLVTADDRVVLTDFGLATFASGDGAMTGPGMVLGSPQFVAPERARSGVSDPRTDLWSLGATLYAAVEGRSPYARADAMATLSALATEPPDPPRRAGPLTPVLTGLLHRDPARRLAAAEVEPLLRAVAAGGSPAPRPTGRGTPDLLPTGRGADGLTVTTSRSAATPRDGPAATWSVGAASDAGNRPAAPAAGGLPARVGRRRDRCRLVAATSTVALVVAVGAAMALRPGTGRAPVPQAGATAVAPVADRAAAFPCGGPAPGGAVPVRSAAPPDGEFALVPGWTWYRDPGGFRIAAPVGWLRWTDAGTTCFREPRGARLLSVGEVAVPADPVGYWRAQERRLTAAGALADYQRVEISGLDLFRTAALWECRWRDAAGDPLHSARLLVVTAPGRAYTVAWRTGEFDWQVNATYFLMIRQSFRPAA